MIVKRHAPPNVGAAASRRCEFACPAQLFGALSHVGQATATSAPFGDAAAVVDDLDGQEVGGGDMDGEP